MQLPEIDPHSARLYGIVARTRRRAVIFRRGPSRSVRLLVWNLASDTLEPGQWFKGRIYERRCDLSPDGELLACFAASFRPPFYSWTAISRPPWLTALALWPKGDCWGGGGLFESGWSFALNHRPEPKPTDREQHETRLAEGFSLPRRMRISLLGETPGWGEDDPICWMRMHRDGWTFAPPAGEAVEHGLRHRRWFTYDPPVTLEKPIGKTSYRLCLAMHAIHERQGRWYVETAAIKDAKGKTLDLGRVDWADLDHNGDVLLAVEGRLLRINPRHALAADGRGSERLVADLNAMTFEPIEAPAAARSWR
jgi:hypothetical protein